MKTTGEPMLRIYSAGLPLDPADDIDLPTERAPDDPDGFTTIGAVAVTRLDTPLRHLHPVRYGVGVVMSGDDIFDIDAGLEHARQFLTALSMANRLRRYA